ncbi:hypothetical protein [Pseudomonas jinjuensis]|nr:hypothetical protein [Pseudomonas jinjuensis]
MMIAILQCRFNDPPWAMRTALAGIGECIDGDQPGRVRQRGRPARG